MESRTLCLVTPIASNELLSRFNKDEYDWLGVDAGILKVQDYSTCIGALGDFDSLEHDEMIHTSTIVRLNSIKDTTDTAEAIAYGKSLGYTDIIVLAGIGKRFDHSLANILLLHQYDVTFVNETSCIFAKDHSFTLDQTCYDRFSLFALENSIISIHNAAYPLDHYSLLTSDPLCVSNQWIDGECVTIEVHSGKILVILTNENERGSYETMR